VGGKNANRNYRSDHRNDAPCGCSRSGSETSAAGATDADLEQAVKAALASDSQLPSGISVSANVEKNESTLSGTVPSEELRLRAIELAKTSKPGLLVTDKLDVKPPEISRSEYTEDMARQARDKAKALGDRISKSLDDAWIYTKIMTKLAANPDTPASKIHVDVMNNVVTLRGEVESPAPKAEAERIAKETDGVKRVNNFLRVHATS
jgi:osmotically-inducible protein OsmY